MGNPSPVLFQSVRSGEWCPSHPVDCCSPRSYSSGWNTLLVSDTKWSVICVLPFDFQFLHTKNFVLLNLLGSYLDNSRLMGH